MGTSAAAQQKKTPNKFGIINPTVNNDGSVRFRPKQSFAQSAAEEQKKMSKSARKTVDLMLGRTIKRGWHI